MKTETETLLKSQAQDGRFSVIMHVMDKGALLSVKESTGYMRRNNAAQHAAKCADEFAARYPGAEVRKHVSDRWVISDKHGYSFAQFDVQ
jgi:hypothetical protein